MCWMILGSNSGRGKWFFLLLHSVEIISVAHSACYSVCIGSSFLQAKLSGVQLTTHVHLVPMLRTNEAIFLLPYMPACCVHTQLCLFLKKDIKYSIGIFFSSHDRNLSLGSQIMPLLPLSSLQFSIDHTIQHCIM